MRVLHVVGTRPNLVKMAPVIGTLRERFPEWHAAVVHTGQHYDRLMSEIFLEELGVPEPDHLLGVGSGSHAEQIARVLERLEPVLRAERPDLVIVPGDVNSTLGAALCAAKLGIAVAHLESGLRSFDRTMPEETSRIGADLIASLCFLHCEEAVENLRAEGVEESRMKFVGNTMIDTLVALTDRIRERRAAATLGLEVGGYLLVTLHRPALVDGPLLAEAMQRLSEVGRELPVVFPIHPRTRKMLGGASYPGVTLTDPVGYLDFLSLEFEAGAVLTDSGGIQEETTYLGIPCFTLRDNTERPVTIRAGTNTLLGLDPARITQIPELLRARPAADRAGSAGEAEEPARPYLWDGRAAERVADVLADW
ncbi:MAG: UDP-N-acetylglucosamine 2-epimerase (non-hydrolyzing) [Actinomycetota bacterium]